MTPVVEVEGLVKTYGDVVALAGVSLRAQPGEVVGVLGPSGAGKTTLFRCLTGLTRADEGRIVVAGREISTAASGTLRAARRDTALIFQQFNLVRRLTAVENVVGGRLPHLRTWRVVLRRFARAERQRALRCLDAVGLLTKAWARADQLSGGQQQRVAIARALAQEAKIVFADEPVASLDPESAASVLDTLRAVAAGGVAVVTSLHQVHLALAYADRVVALRHGKVVEEGPVRDFDERALQQIYERDRDSRAR